LDKVRKEKYRNPRTGEIKEFLVEADENNHIPMYRYSDGDEWKAVPKWSLNVVNSSEFFASAHEPRVKFTKPPLDGSDFPYGVT
jgi:hypothetical protein